MLLYSGVRRGEALALKWKNVDMDMACLSVMETAYKLNGEYAIKEPKTPHSRRQVALVPSLALILREHRAKQEAEDALPGQQEAAAQKFENFLADKGQKRNVGNMSTTGGRVDIGVRGFEPPAT